MRKMSVAALCVGLVHENVESQAYITIFGQFGGASLHYPFYAEHSGLSRDLSVEFESFLT